MPLIGEIAAALEAFAPLAYQESYDNAGLLIGEADAACRGVLVSLDVTEAVIAEAVARGCNLVVAHHPLIFRGLKQLTGADEVQKTAILAVRNGIAVYAIHTNLDNVPDGVNRTIADRLGLTGARILAPGNAAGTGAGLVGRVEPQPETAFLALLREVFGVPVVRHSPLLGRRVTRVAVCGGAGSFLIPNALAEKADFLVTADVKYHDFFRADGRLVVADVGHFESEQFTVDLLVAKLTEKFPNFAVLKAGTLTNPVYYYQ